ncbi:hypothetical protein Vretimale_4848 [Volvox reticuliferus]|uniref:Uncharacterized protein n=1 Tax=Volvox reticuliferus TaxID=1737510 RepID=A0A8J4DGA8_9CHLO|nr:hypothetical protein Vretimale_4848 [Volvox reticuliferus]
MSVDYRPVDCDTNQPLPPPPAPGYVSQVVYDDVIEPGWNWFSYSRPYAELIQEGAGVNGSAATCVALSPNGGLSFTCRACGGPGYQPFKNASALSFWIRPNSNSSDPYFSSTPNGIIPPVKVFVLQDGSYGKGDKLYCGNEVYLNSTVGGTCLATSLSWKPCLRGNSMQCAICI